MKEKVLIKSEKRAVWKASVIIIVIGLLITLLLYFTSSRTNYFMNELYDHAVNRRQEHQATCCYLLCSGSPHTCSNPNSDYICSSCKNIEKHPTRLGYAISHFDAGNDFYVLIPVALSVIIASLVLVLLTNHEMTVTDKRITGRIILGKRVDLPLDLVSATSTIPLLSGVSVSTSSGRISFCAIKNCADVYKVINDLLIIRQEKTAKVQPVANAPIVYEKKADEADLLKKYKDLLDSGVITQEEFDAKKKQLLNLP